MLPFFLLINLFNVNKEFDAGIGVCELNCSFVFVVHIPHPLLRFGILSLTCRMSRCYVEGTETTLLVLTSKRAPTSWSGEGANDWLT